MRKETLEDSRFGEIREEINEEENVTVKFPCFDSEPAAAGPKPRGSFSEEIKANESEDLTEEN